MADYDKIAKTLSAETLITRVLTAVMERTGQTGVNYFRTMIQSSGYYDVADVEDFRAIGLDVSHYDTVMLPNLRQIFRSYRSVIQSQAGWSGVLAREINMRDADKAVLNYILYGYENINLGEINVIDRRGPLGALYKQMQLDGQVIVSNYVESGTLTEVGICRGDLSESITDQDVFLSNCHTGVLSFRCVNESTTAPQMQVTNTLAPNSAAAALSIGLPDGTTLINGENLLTVNKSYDDMRLGITGMVLTRPGLASPTVSGDNGSTPLLSSVSIASPYDGDCYKGQFYVRITRQAPGSATWKIEYFADSGETIKVHGTTATGTSGSVVVAETLNAGSVVTFTLNKANAATVLTSTGDDITITIDIRTPRVGDEWTMTTTNHYLGKAATLISMLWPGTLPAVPVKPGACTDDLAGAGAGNVDNGLHTYKITFVGPGGESPAGTISGGVTVADKTVNGKVALTAIPTGAANTGVTARKIYRTVAGGAGDHKLVATISDNSTTTYQDNTADASLGAAAPTSTQWDDSLFTAFSIS